MPRSVASLGLLLALLFATSPGCRCAVIQNATQAGFANRDRTLDLGCDLLGPERLVPPAIVRLDRTPCWTDWWWGSKDALDRDITRWEINSVQTSLDADFDSASQTSRSAYRIAERLHVAGDQRAVDYWARTIAWADVALAPGEGIGCSGANHGNCEACDDDRCATKRIRQSAAIRILSSGQCYGRLDPASHLWIAGSDRLHRIDVVHRGFTWNDDDFGRLLVFAPPQSAPGNVQGRGVPLIVQSQGIASPLSNMNVLDGELLSSGTDRVSRMLHGFGPRSKSFGRPMVPALQSRSPKTSFILPGTTFSATALMHFPISMFLDSETVEPAAIGQIDLVNPLAEAMTCECTGADHRSIAESPAMSTTYSRQDNVYNPLTAFLGGGNGIDQAGLWFLEPYQPDKIPLIFVHGLLSDPTTFIEMADAVRADPQLRSRYQIWGFRYPTGDAFLRSAATLRRELADAYRLHDQQCSPMPAKRAVLVGHSMGGLVAKLQVADSGDQLWDAVSNVPFARLRGTPAEIESFRSDFFFQANANIGRVVYIATPHGGSPLASCCVGRIGSRLAGRRSTQQQYFDDLLRRNPGTFSGELTDSLPSSVDLLRPSSDLLGALAAIPSIPSVTIHQIIGDHCRLPLVGRSDGVVPIESAFRREAVSTKMVDASHTSIQRSPQAQAELLKILHRNLSEQSFAPECPSLRPETLEPVPILQTPIAKSSLIAP